MCVITIIYTPLHSSSITAITINNIIVVWQRIDDYVMLHHSLSIPVRYILLLLSMIIGSWGTILDVAIATRATMEASRLGAKKMLFVFGRIFPSA